MIIGDSVLVTHLIEKQVSFEPRHETNYVVVPCKPFYGFYMGFRYRNKGHTVDYGEDGKNFRASGSVKHLLVLKNERTNPVFADPTTTICQKQST